MSSILRTHELFLRFRHRIDFMLRCEPLCSMLSAWVSVKLNLPTVKLVRHRACVYNVT